MTNAELLDELMHYLFERANGNPGEPPEPELAIEMMNAMMAIGVPLSIKTLEQKP